MNLAPNRQKQPRVHTSAADRLPPHSLEAEAGFLGCGVLDALATLNAAEERGMEASWFYDLRHQLIFAALQDQQRKGQTADFITTHQWLADRGQLEQVGGLEYLMTLDRATPSAANADYYLEILREKWLLRQVLRLGTELASAAQSIEQGEKTEPEELVARAERQILRLSQDRTEASEASIQPVVLEVLSELEEYHRGRPQMRGLSTGLGYVDKLLCGMGGRNGNYIVLGARPGVGKTSWATQVAVHVAKDLVWFEEVKDAAGQPVMEKAEDGGMDRYKVTSHQGLPVAIFSQEMEKHALAMRMLFQRGQADMQRWRTGYAQGEDLPKLTGAANQLAVPNNIFLDDAARTTIDTLKAKARRMHRQHGIKLFVIDYIQLLRAGGKRFREDRVQELSEISAEIAALGKELQTPFIVLAQMNREFDKEPNRKPRLSDLKDCGSIEQDADLVGFLYYPKQKQGDKDRYEAAMDQAFGNDWSARPARVDLLWAKNRYGPGGVCKLLFQKSCTRFLDYEEWLRSQGGLASAPADEPEQQQALDTFEED